VQAQFINDHYFGVDHAVLDKLFSKKPAAKQNNVATKMQKLWVMNISGGRYQNRYAVVLMQ
jgi:hypothetical protein